MSRTRQYHKRQAKAIQRRRRTAAERLQRDCRQAQQAAEALQQAVEDLDLPGNVVAEIEGRLRGSALHVMLALRCRSREVVVADEELHGPDMVGELLGKGQHIAHQP